MLSNKFTVQYSPDLTGTNWITLQTFSNLLTSPYLFLDPAGTAGSRRGFTGCLCSENLSQLLRLGVEFQ
jgi:hypothetical protein